MKAAPSCAQTRIFTSLVGAALVSLGACSGLSRPTEAPDTGPPGGRGVSSAEELRVYVDEVKPEPVPTIRYEEPLRWKALNSFFAIAETRNGPHLIEMSWECDDLHSNQIYADMADRRSKRGILRAKIDTLRGCRIENFYKLPEVEAVEREDDGTTQSDRQEP